MPTLARKNDPGALEPQDCVALIVLQTADTGLATIDEMQAAAKQMTHDDWAPTIAVLESCVRRLVRDGLLGVGPATGTDHPQGFTTTETGRVAISQLLLRPIPPSQGNFTRLCMSMKLCLFHCLDASQRPSQIAELSEMYLQTLEQLRRLRPRQGPGQHRSFPTDYWLCHEIERLETELAWLGGLENWFAGRHAAE
jgi:hypothetical protein